MTVPYSPTVLTDSNGTARRGTAGLLAGRPYLLAALGATTISSSAVLIVLSRGSAAGTAFYRTAIALPLLLALAAIEQRRRGPRQPAQRARAALAGVFLAVDLLLWRYAIADVGAGVATVLGNLQILFVAGLAWLAWRERPSRAVVLAIPVVMLGVVLVSGIVGHPEGGLARPHPVAGIWYGIGTSVAYAGFLLILRGSSAGSAHVAGPVADATAGAAMTSLAYGALFGGLALHPLWPSIGWLALLALLSQTAGWLLITSSLPRLPAAVSSLMLLLQPAALALAAAVLGQRPTLPQILGAALTCGGALIASSSAARATSPLDTATAPPDTTTNAPDTAAAPPDTAASPPDTAAAPPDTAASPPDTAAAPPDLASGSPDAQARRHETQPS